MPQGRPSVLNNDRSMERPAFVPPFFHLALFNAFFEPGGVLTIPARVCVAGLMFVVLGIKWGGGRGGWSMGVRVDGPVIGCGRGEGLGLGGGELVGPHPLGIPPWSAPGPRQCVWWCEESWGGQHSQWMCGGSAGYWKWERVKVWGGGGSVTFGRPRAS